TPVIVKKNNGKTNYYWMGCFEPRADVEVKETGSVGSLGSGDAPPKVSTFVPMDANSKSDPSFCPPPIASLTDDFSYLQKAISNMTPQGSTRLDMGVVAGWYALSPKWKGVWEDESAPADYDDSVHKVMVFMTDGEMNTKDDPKSKKQFDWLCSKDPDGCDDLATNVMQDTCSAMKKKDIEIFTLSYGKDADVENIRKCATSTQHFYTASPATIQSVYETIASVIGADVVRLTQ
ncbi:MAG TPA: vWA domain-containing protein, partial [Sinorhizobium sp.]|nr:vWA domain-containing protein [Sinorhizobium sp.]